MNPFEETEVPAPSTTPTAQSSAQKKPAPKAKEIRPLNEPRVRRYNGTSKLTESDSPPNVPMTPGSRTSGAEHSSATEGYHSESDEEHNVQLDDNEAAGERFTTTTSAASVTPFDSNRKERKRRRQVDLSGIPSFAAASAAIAAAATSSSSSQHQGLYLPVVAPTPPPAAPPATKRVRGNQYRAGNNYYGLSRLDPSNKDVAYNSVVLDMHNTNRVVKLIENLNCLKRFTVHGEDISTQFSLVC